MVMKKEGNLQRRIRGRLRMMMMMMMERRRAGIG
jgi:hypothetical protein